MQNPQFNDHGHYLREPKEWKSEGIYKFCIISEQPSHHNGHQGEMGSFSCENETQTNTEGPFMVGSKKGEAEAKDNLKDKDCHIDFSEWEVFN